jgi:CBS domain-containing protein
MRAADVMTPDPVCVSPDASITDAIRLMLERKFSGFCRSWMHAALWLGS